MDFVLIVLGCIICAAFAIRTRRLLISALWLAGCSALTALLLYLLGAAEIAVIELSVGAGLVTVLFVFAINIAGDEPLVTLPSLVPAPLAWIAALAAVGLGGWMALPNLRPDAGLVQADTFAKVLWEHRSLDVLLQVVLIIGGVLTVLGLLAEGRARARKENH